MLKRTSVSILTMGAALLLLASFVKGISPLKYDAPTPALLTQAVENLLWAIGSLIALWYFFTALAVVVSLTSRILGTVPVRLERTIRALGAPLLRRVAAWTAASTMVFGAPAMANTAGLPPLSDESVAASSTESRNATFLVDLGWATTPRATEPAGSGAGAARDPIPIEQATHTPEDPSGSAKGAPPAPTEHVVQAGDTLWGIAKAHLERDSENVTAADIAEHWPRWHLANSHTIGSNPDLITPGMTLHAPRSEES